MGIRIKSFKDLLASDLQHDENLFLNHVSTFALKVSSLIEEDMKKQSLQTFPRIKQIQAGWKGRVDILKPLMENVTLLEDGKSAIFFKVFDAIKGLEGPPLIKHSTLILAAKLDDELSKLKDKWAREFNDMLDFSKDNMHTWTIDYVNLNNNIFISIVEAPENLSQVEREILKMNIKQEINVPPLQDFKSGWREKQLVTVTETAQPW